MSVVALYNSDGTLKYCYNIPYVKGDFIKGLIAIEADNKMKNVHREDDGSDEYWHDDNKLPGSWHQQV